MFDQRFVGGCEQIAAVDIAALKAWIEAIPFEEWPQQNKPGADIKPAMVTDPEWHEFGEKAAPVVANIMQRFPNCLAYQRMLSVVMPGHEIPPHRDEQARYWLCRVHVPLTSNGSSMFIVSGLPCNLRPGFAYRVNTQAEHAVTNDGILPRIHFMFDVRKA